ncbi:MAG: hypothetical protein WCO52_04295 [bacterium]
MISAGQLQVHPIKQFWRYDGFNSVTENGEAKLVDYPFVNGMVKKLLKLALADCFSSFAYQALLFHYAAGGLDRKAAIHQFPGFT